MKSMCTRVSESLERGIGFDFAASAIAHSRFFNQDVVTWINRVQPGHGSVISILHRQLGMGAGW